MCRLLGISYKKSRKIPKKLLQDFWWLSVKHPHGWGLCSFTSYRKDWYCKKGPYPAFRVFPVSPVKSHIHIAHVRRATKGKVHYLNCHPFVRNGWSLAHNGTLFHIRKVKFKKFRPFGWTDSEKILCLLLDWYSETKYIRYKDEVEWFHLLHDFLWDLQDSQDSMGILNLLFSDGKYLYAYRGLDGRKSLYYNQLKSRIVVCSEQLDSISNWTPIGIGDMLVFDRGRIIYDF